MKGREGATVRDLTARSTVIVAVGAVLVAALTGCTSRETAGVEAPPPTEMATMTPTDTSEPPPSPANTPRPTRTPRRHESPLTPSASTVIPPATGVPPSDKGPWLVFTAEGEEGMQLWAMNADGTGLTQLTHQTQDMIVHFAVNHVPAQDGTYAIAYVTATSKAVWLHMLAFPGGADRLITPLIPEGDTSSDQDPSLIRERRACFDQAGILRWSPDGTQLAFVGAIDGPTVDVYKYMPATCEITRLTDGPAHAWNLLWSPDGEYIVHTGNEIFLGSGSRYADGRVWAVRADGSGVTEFPGEGADYEGWIAPDTLLLCTGANVGTCASGLRSVNVTDGTVHSIWPGCFDGVAYNLTNNIALITIVDIFLMVPGKENDIPPDGPGTYILREGEPEFLSADIVNVYWSAEQNTFYGGDLEGRIYQISPSGQITELDAPTDTVPLMSPDGQYCTWSGTSDPYKMPFFDGGPHPPPFGLWIDRPDGTRIRVDETVPDSTGAEHVIWSPDSKVVFFVSNEKGYIASAPDFVPRQLGISLPLGVFWQFQWVPGR